MSIRELEDRVIVITGAGKGLGKALALGLHDRGARVALIARSEHPISEIADSLGSHAIAVPTDIGDPDSVRSAFKRVGETFGYIDALINNAAVYPNIDIATASDQDLQAVYNTNLLGLSYCIRESIPWMDKQNRGMIINMSSESVLDPMPYVASYSASKSAVETLGRGLKLELSERNIRLTSLRLGNLANPDSTFDFDSEINKKFIEAGTKYGMFAKMGAQGIDLSTAVSTVTFLLNLPEDSIIDLLELRSAPTKTMTENPEFSESDKY